MDDRSFNSLLFGGIPLAAGTGVWWLSLNFEDEARRFLPLKPLSGAQAWIVGFPGILILGLLLSYLPALLTFAYGLPKRTVLAFWALALPLSLMAVRIGLGLL